MTDFNMDSSIKKALDSYHPDFKPFFETRVMGKIAALNDQDFNHLFNRAFLRVVIPSAAALIALIVTIAAANGSLSPDSLMGTGNLDIETLTAMTISGY